MASHRALRNKGKVSFSKHFQKFENGDSVALVKESGTVAHFSYRMQGRTGRIIGKRGLAYIVEVKELNLLKQIIVSPIHLKRITTI